MFDVLLKMYMQSPGYTIILLMAGGAALVFCIWLFLKLISAGDLSPKPPRKSR